MTDVCYCRISYNRWLENINTIWVWFLLNLLIHTNFADKMISSKKWRNFIKVCPTFLTLHILELIPGSHACFGIMYFVPYINPSWARCAITRLRRAMLLSFDMKTVAKLICKPQHVGNISSDVPYLLTFLCHIGYCFYIKWQKRSAAWVRGDTSSSAWSCMSYNWKKYMIPKHAFEPGMTVPERGLYFYHI